MIQNLEKQQTDEGRDNRNRDKVCEFLPLGMFPPFKYKPDAQKIVCDDSAACGQNITKRIFNSGEIIFPGEDFREVNTQYFEAADFDNRT